MQVHDYRSERHNVLLAVLSILIVLFGIMPVMGWAQDGTYVLNTEYDGDTVACSKLEEAQEYVRLGKEESKEAATAYFNQDNSCFNAPTKFKMEKVLSTHQRGTASVRIVEGKVFGGYHPLFGYNAFTEPTTVYFIVGIPVTLYPGRFTST